MREAFVAVQQEADAGSADAPSDAVAQESPGDKPADEAPTPEAAETPAPEAAVPAEKPLTPNAQAQLQRLETLVAQGREAELSPREAGILRKIRADTLAAHQAEQQQEATFRDLFLTLEAERLEDPEAYFARLDENPEYARFHKMYKTAHPDVTAESPMGQVVNAAAVERKTAEQFFGSLDQAVEAMATDAGLTAGTLAKIRDEATGPWQYLSNFVTEAVKSRVAAEVAKELPKIQAAERKAALLQAQREFATERIITPRRIDGNQPGAPGQANREPSRPMTMAEANAQARKELEVAV